MEMETPTIGDKIIMTPGTEVITTGNKVILIVMLSLTHITREEILDSHLNHLDKKPHHSGPGIQIRNYRIIWRNSQSPWSYGNGNNVSPPRGHNNYPRNNGYMEGNAPRRNMDSVNSNQQIHYVPEENLGQQNGN